MVELLLYNGAIADIRSSEGRGKTPLDSAIETGNIRKLIKFLMNKTHEKNTLFECAGNREIIELLSAKLSQAPSS